MRAGDVRRVIVDYGEVYPYESRLRHQLDNERVSWTLKFDDRVLLQETPWVRPGRQVFGGESVSVIVSSGESCIVPASWLDDD